MVRKIRLIDYDLLTRFASRRNQQQHYSISVSAVGETIPFQRVFWTAFPMTLATRNALEFLFG